MSAILPRWFLTHHAAKVSLSDAIMENGAAKDRGEEPNKEALEQAALALYESQKQHAVDRSKTAQAHREGRAELVAMCGRTFAVSSSQPAIKAATTCKECLAELEKFADASTLERARLEQEETAALEARRQASSDEETKRVKPKRMKP